MNKGSLRRQEIRNKNEVARHKTVKPLIGINNNNFINRKLRDIKIQVILPEREVVSQFGKSATGSSELKRPTHNKILCSVGLNLIHYRARQLLELMRFRIRLQVYYGTPPLW